MGIAFAHAKIIGRKSGQSLSACAAYRHGKELEDEQYGKTHDYSGRRGVIAEGIALPVGAPEWMGDLQALTNAIERREERSNQRAIAQLVREYVIALPHELDGEKAEWLLKNILKEGATREGMVAMWAIHEPNAAGDERNVHAHVMLSMREIEASDPDGFGAKQREWNSRAAQERFKGVIERESNKMLERCGIEERISFEWGKGREGTIHMGHGAVALERKGIATEVGNANREIQARNAERGELDLDLGDVREQLERLLLEPDAVRPGPEGPAESAAGRQAPTAPAPEVQAPEVQAPEWQARPAGEAVDPELAGYAKAFVEHFFPDNPPQVEPPTERAVEPKSEPLLEVDSAASVGELSRSAERAAGSLEQVAGGVAGGIAKGLESFALGFEAYFFGASRQAPGGAEYVPPSAAQEPPAAPEKSQTRKDKEFMGKQDENAHRDANVKDLMNRSPVAIDATLIARVQRDLEEPQRRREELYRDRDDDWDRDRER
jgi:hypothetical protein